MSLRTGPTAAPRVLYLRLDCPRLPPRGNIGGPSLLRTSRARPSQAPETTFVGPQSPGPARRKGPTAASATPGEAGVLHRIPVAGPREILCRGGEPRGGGGGAPSAPGPPPPSDLRSEPALSDPPDRPDRLRPPCPTESVQRGLHRCWRGGGESTRARVQTFSRPDLGD